MGTSCIIMARQKYVTKLKPLARESSYAYERDYGLEFEKVCRGYAIGEYQKRGVEYSDEDVRWVVADVHWRTERLV